MANIENIVEINITRETRGVSRTGFGTPLFLRASASLIADGDPRVESFTSLAGVEDAYGTDDPAYTAAQRVFGQQRSPTTFKVGQQFSDDADILEALSAVQEADDDWYFLLTYQHSGADIITVADWVEAQSKLYFASYNDADALDPNAETDPGFDLNQREMMRTALIYAEDPEEFPEAAWVALQATKNPGSSTWKFRSVSGVTPSDLTPTDMLTLKGDKYSNGKGYNIYTRVAGRNMFSEGKVAGGEFIDVMRFSDWLEARMRERIFLTMMNSEKIPQTRAGYTVIEGRMREVLQEGVRRNGLQSFEITVPDPNEADPNDLANRVASGFRFRARLAGAIHFVEIDGTLTVEEL